MIGRKPPTSPDSALAGDIFDQLCAAGTLKSILHHHRHLCDVLKIKPTNFPHFYPKLRAKINNWRAQALWNKFDKRASSKCYNRGKACSQSKVLIIGAGPCGLRAAIEAQLLGARVVVVEKRDRITRNNVLHLWPFVIHDLKALGAKKFFGKFCAGAIDHISIRQLQCILLKVALILGVEIHEGVSFQGLLPPPADQHAEKTGWRAVVTPREHPVSQYEIDVLIGADGKRNTLEGFTRKEFRGKLAIAITANFINRRTEAEARVEEISGVAFIFNQKFFKDLYADTRIDLENIVYYKDDTHYFVMTAKKHSLIDKGVILHDYAETARLLDPSNVDKEALLKYAKEAADFSTNYQLPDMDFAVNHYGQPDVAMFDFTSMYAAENASRVVEKNGHKLLQLLVGDSLLEPFWPTGSGCARGFLSSMDACWALRSWATDGTLSPLDVVAERESIYRLLGQTTPENLQKDLMSYTLDPASRYPNLNTRSVLPYQVKNLFETDDPVSMELALAPTAATEIRKKRRWRDSQVHPDTLVQWLKRQVCLHQDLHVQDVTHSFRDGLVLCAIIGRYRPDLLDFAALDAMDIAENNQRAFDILEKEYGILPVMTGGEMADTDVPDRLTMLSYLSQVYDAFRGEIPHTKHPRLQADLEEDVPPPRPTSNIAAALRKRSSPQHREALPSRKGRKRRSDKSFGGEERQQRIGEIDENRRDRQRRMKMARELQTTQLMKSLAMMQANHWSPDEDAEGFKDYSLFVYRQTAPEFTDRVKELEMKLLYPDRESRLRAELRSRRAPGETDEDFSGRIKDLEAKLRGTATPAQKKPHDLLRAIGKIEKTDWQIQEIEKKIKENQYGQGVHETPEKVPKWSRQQFADKFEAVERKLLKKGLDAETATKYAEVDVSLKRLEQKLKDGSTLESGQRGSNKVSAMAEQFAPKLQEKLPLTKSSSKGAVTLPTPSASDMCHFCDKRVYLMERVIAEGRFFHRSCFKCEYCFSSLRVGSYMYDGEGRYGYRFYCNQHFRMPGTIKQRSQPDRVKTPLKHSPRTYTKPQTPANKNLTPPITELDRGATPERIEFENEGAQDEDSEMDEDEWTDRNFGASAAEASSDDVLDMSDSDEDEEVEEALMTADETREVAERWNRRHSGRVSGIVIRDGQDSCEADDSDDVDEYSEDDESDTPTDGEEDLRALELRKQEVRVLPARTVADTDTGSDTEVASDERTTTGEIENSATEISTDSEFEHDGTTPTRPEIPDILTAHQRKRPTDEPKRVQVKSGLIGRDAANKEGVKLDIRPLVETNNFVNSVLSRPSPLVNPRRGDYLLSKTQSTEGIATKMSLELRKKYLLGAPTAPHAVAKSATATALDSKLRNFASSITECQKLLNPGNEISPTMQAFLQTTGKPRPPTSPTLLEPSLNLPATNLLRKGKELPSLSSSYVHVCGKPDDLENKDPNVLEDVQNKNVSDDFRPRSPAHETSIVVPQIPWQQPKEDSESESESESETPSEEDEEEDEVKCDNREKKVLPPRLVIRDTQGELVGDEVFEMDSLQPDVECQQTAYNEGHSALSMAAQIELARSKIDELKSSIARGQTAISGALERPSSADLTSLDSLSTMQTNVLTYEDQIQPDSIMDLPECGNSALDSIEPIQDPYDSIEPTAAFESVVEPGTNDPAVCSRTIEELARESLRSPSPLSAEDSCKTFAANTDTELSDWARDGALAVSDDLVEEVEERKAVQKPKSLLINEGFGHVCGRLLASAENLEFADTDPSISESSVSHQNRGYVRLGSEPDIINPITNADNASSSSSSTSTSSSSRENAPNVPVTTEESTTSEPTTVKNVSEGGLARDAATYWPLEDMSPLTPQEETFKDNNKPELFENEVISVKSLHGRESPFHRAQDSIIKSEKTVEEKKEFNEYVQRLQGRISPFHNAKDSIDYRKSKQKVEKEPPVQPQPIKEEKSPMTQESKKLQEISRERTIQKDLVHEMVMKKVLAGKKSPGERKARRGLKLSPNMGESSVPTLDGFDAKVPAQVPETTEQSVVKPLPLSTKPPTPVSSKKTVRPASVHLGTRSLKGCSSLPDTPLTNPDAFSMPDLATDFDFKTPVAPPREKRLDASKDLPSAEREKFRESARARARLKSDEELGLSPEERLKAMKDKVHKILDTPKRSADDLPKRSTVKTTLKGGRVLKSSSTSTVFDKLRGVGDKMASVAGSQMQKSTSDLVASCKNDGQLSPDSAGPSTSPISSSKGGDLRSRDRERRKSIIQAVSDFFHKKPTSPSKSPSPKSLSPSKPEKFTDKLKLNAKSRPNDSVERVEVVTPPPVPPPPMTYVPQALISEESGSELESASMSVLSTPSHVNSDPASQRARMTKRMARQAQLKRLRMAQEIQRRLEEVEEKQREMETRGVRIEKALRGEEGGREAAPESSLLKDWFELVRERNELRRYERELIVRAKEIELEDRHARLQQQLRERLSKDDSMKTQEEVVQEGVILREMLETVEKRDALNKILEEERQRYQEEEKDLESQVLAKGLRLTPIRKYEYQSTV